MRNVLKAAALGVARAYSMGAVTVVAQNTARTTDLTADGYTWAQGGPMIVDNYGHIIAMVQHNVATGYIGFVVSSDGGATWSDITLTSMSHASGEMFILRGAMTYDTINDLIHILWDCSGATDGILYRRYSIQRNGSNVPTSITRVAGINLQIDYETTGTMFYVHPCLQWLPIGTHGTLVACWGAYNSAAGASKCEIRMTTRTLSNSVADNTASNWVAPAGVGNGDTTAIGNAPQTAYNRLFTGPNNVGIPHPSLGVKRSGANQYDMTLLYSEEHAEWQMKLVPYLGGGEWNTGELAVNVCAIDRTGGDTGYDNKWELGTEPRHDTANDRMWFGIGTWNGTGDTWTIGYQESDGTLGDLIDVYDSPVGDNSASDFVTGDLAVFNGKGLFVTYTDLPNKDTYAVLYSFAGTILDGPTIIYSATPCDIPTVYPDLVDNKALVLFRDFNAESTDDPPVYTPPYDGYFVTVAVTR